MPRARSSRRPTADDEVPAVPHKRAERRVVRGPSFAVAKRDRESRACSDIRAFANSAIIPPKPSRGPASHLLQLDFLRKRPALRALLRRGAEVVATACA